MKKILKNNRGFTILELLIATAVFSTILLLCSYALIQIGRVYYKGITMTRTQETARTIMEDIAQSIQFSGQGVNVLAPSGGLKGICIDSRRYSYREGIKLGNNPSRHVLVADDGVACGSGTPILNVNDVSVVNASTNPREFLSEQTRLSALEVTLLDATTQLYSVRVKVVAGDNDLLDNPATPDASCRSGISGGQFCAVADISTIVQKRLN